MLKKIFTTLFLFTIITSSLVTTKAEEMFFAPTLDESYFDGSNLFGFGELPLDNNLLLSEDISLGFEYEQIPNFPFPDIPKFCRVVDADGDAYASYPSFCDSNNTTFISCNDQYEASTNKKCTQSYY